MKPRRIKAYPVSQVLDMIVRTHLIENGSRTVEIGEERYHVRLNQKRYRLIGQQPKCSACGLEAVVAILEQQEPGKHNLAAFNFYAIQDGKCVKLTVDHIKPVAKGGSSKMKNLQVLCELCNGLKGSSKYDLEKVKLLRQAWDIVADVPGRKTRRKAFVKERERLFREAKTYFGVVPSPWCNFSSSPGLEAKSEITNSTANDGSLPIGLLDG